MCYTIAGRKKTKRIENILCIFQMLIYSEDMSNTSSPISPARAESIARFNAAYLAWDGEAYLAASVAHAADIERIVAQDTELLDARP